jgi:hypothetical protein
VTSSLLFVNKTTCDKFFIVCKQEFEQETRLFLLVSEHVYQKPDKKKVVDKTTDGMCNQFIIVGNGGYAWMTNLLLYVKIRNYRRPVHYLFVIEHTCV